MIIHSSFCNSTKQFTLSSVINRWPINHDPFLDTQFTGLAQVKIMKLFLVTNNVQEKAIGGIYNKHGDRSKTVMLKNKILDLSYLMAGITSNLVKQNFK